MDLVENFIACTQLTFAANKVKLSWELLLWLHDRLREILNQIFVRSHGFDLLKPMKDGENDSIYLSNQAAFKWTENKNMSLHSLA